jgi:hypothetical protein
MENFVPRQELDAKMETIEVKLHARLGELFQRLDIVDSHLTRQERAIWSATAVIIGVMFSSMALIVSSFDSGRDTANLAAETRARVNEQLNKTDKLLSGMHALLEDATKAGNHAAPR